MLAEDFRYRNIHFKFSVFYRKWANDKRQCRHFHNSYEILYVVKGERTFFIDDRSYKVKAGDIILISPNILHRAIDTDISGSEIICIYFDESFFSTNYHIGDGKGIGALISEEKTIIGLSLDERKNFEKLLFKVVNEAQLEKTGFEFLIQAYLTEFIVEFCRYKEETNTFLLEHYSPMNEKVSEIVEYIFKNYMEPISLSSLSKRFYISPSYLSRIFKETTNFSFVEYLNIIRVKEAKKLLMDTNLKVAKISEEVGFGSITHFGRVFKEITGYHPLHFRK